MKLKIDKDDLLSVLNICQNVVEKKSTMPILTNILLEVKNDFLSISASDMEISALARVPGGNRKKRLYNS